MPKAPKASKASKGQGKKKQPRERKLTAEEMKIVPQAIREAVERGDVSAKEVLDEILTKYSVLRDAMARRSEVSKECRERTKQEWAALQGAMEAPLRTDATMEQLKSKIETCEMRWQEYTEAIQQNKLETRQASKDMRAAQKELDQAITGHAQLKLPFGKTEAVADAVEPEPDGAGETEPEEEEFDPEEEEFEDDEEEEEDDEEEEENEDETA